MSATLWPIRAARLSGTMTERDGTRTPTTYARPASDRQRAYLASLHAARGWPILDSLSADEASRLIDAALRESATTAPGVPPVAVAGVAAGRYAIDDPDKPGTLAFFHVDKPTEGKWSGYTFVQQQAGPETYPVRAAARRAAILTAISADPSALARYGQTLGVCGRCGRDLTDAESRARGIGPVCLSK